MKQSKLLKKLLTASSRSFIMIDRNLNITDTSFGVERFSEFSHENLINKDIRQAFPETIGLEDTFNSIWTHQVTSFELKGICRTPNALSGKKPTYFDFYIIGTNELEEDDKNIIICIEDVTEIMMMSQQLLQRANELELLSNALFKSKEYIDKVVSSMADALIVTDHQDIIKTINPATSILFGYTKEELINHHISFLLKNHDHVHLLHQELSHNHPFDLQLATSKNLEELENLEKLDKSDRSFKNIEILCLSKSQDEILISFSCSKIFDWQLDHSFGADLHHVYVGRNVTEMHQKQQEILTARQVAEKAAQSKSIFLANMSHEIRTPLNGVLGMTELLLGTSLELHQQDFVENIRLSGNLLLSLINRILDLSKLEQGALELEIRPCNLDECIEEVLEICAFQANQNQVELVARFEEGLPTRLLADTVRLRQILINLIGNAIKFTHDGEVLVIVERDRDVELDSTSSVHLKISIVDTGVGIALEDQNKLFKPFSQVDSSTTRLFGGTGLGLAICRQLVELMGGTINVTSPIKDGKGTCFAVNIALGLAQSPSEQLPYSNHSAMRHKVVLVVDPNLDVHRVISYHLAQVGMTVWGGTDIQEAIAYLQKQKIDLILIDQKLITDSVSLIEKIHSCLEPNNHQSSELKRINTIPILVMINSSHQREVTQIVDQGFQGYITKPINGLRMIKALSSLLTVDTLPKISTENVNAIELPNLKILLAEDNIVNQKVTLTYLSQLHCHADLAENGEQVLEKYHQKNYDIILMDCQMPLMDGYETTQAIRQLEAEMRLRSSVPSHVVIIAMTANAFTEDRDRCLAVGMDDYLSKPIRRKQLKETLEYWMSKFPRQS